MGCLITIPLLLLFITLFFGAALLRLLQAFLGGHLSTFFGRRSREKTENTTEGNTYYGRESGASSRRHRHESRRKIFGPDEGEYVDFEEIKDDSR